jgi:uncharacterized protein (TIGR03083 family)
MDFVAAIRSESDRFYAVADGADPSSPVASCPGWSIADLVWHLGEVHWFWASIIETRATSPDAVEASKPERPTSYESLVAWGRGEVDHLLSALSSTADEETVWTWSPPHQTVGFIRRHQVQEAAVHRWDIEAAAGAAVPSAVEAVAAADAIDELLAVTLPWGVRPDKPLSGSVHLHCTDVAGEWLVAGDGRVTAEHAKGDAALRGTASDLLLAIFKRVGLEGRVEVLGDAAVAEELLARLDMA